MQIKPQLRKSLPRQTQAHAIDVILDPIFQESSRKDDHMLYALTAKGADVAVPNRGPK
jgi:hypothetical protein